MGKISGKKYGLIALGIIALLTIFIYTRYNGLVQKDENLTKTWHNVQNDYQRRVDLIPNLVNAVKASADYEKETLVKIIEQRSTKAAQVNISGGRPTYENYKKTEEANAEVATAANRIIGVIEKYPDIKTTSSFVRLQDQMIGTERRIKFSRNDFNKAVMEYNTSVRSFPTSIVAKIFGFDVKEGFKADAGADKVSEITFNK